MFYQKDTGFSTCTLNSAINPFKKKVITQLRIGQ